MDIKNYPEREAKLNNLIKEFRNSCELMVDALYRSPVWNEEIEELWNNDFGDVLERILAIRCGWDRETQSKIEEVK